MRAKSVKNKFKIKLKNRSITLKIFDVEHGMIMASGYLIDKVAYISDCNKNSEFLN